MPLIFTAAALAGMAGMPLCQDDLWVLFQSVRATAVQLSHRAGFECTCTACHGHDNIDPGKLSQGFMILERFGECG